jgi:predicted transcriptional regulator
MKPGELLVAQWLRSHGLQQADIARILGHKTHQNIGYHMRKLRSAFIDKRAEEAMSGGGIVSLLVGYVSDPPPPSELTKAGEQDHNCPHFCEMAAYAQLEDLPKHRKIAVLLNLLAEVEKE